MENTFCATFILTVLTLCPKALRIDTASTLRFWSTSRMFKFPITGLGKILS